MKNYHLYIITNLINDKKYVGITTAGCSFRFEWHLGNARRFIEKHQRIILYLAVRKHGSENFKMEFLEEGDSWEHLCELEKEYIQRFKTHAFTSNHRGYNMTLGGDGSTGATWEWSEEQKQRFNKNIRDTEEYIEQQSVGNARYWLGKKLSTNTIERIKKKLEGKCGKFCVINGTFYNSAREAAEKIGFHVETIRYRCRTPKFLEYYYIPGTNDTCGKPQPCVVRGKEYVSISEATRETGIKSGTIRKRIRNKNLSEYAYID